MEKQEIRLKVDRYTRGCLTVIAVLLTVLIVGLWSTALPPVGVARAADDKDRFGETGTRIAAQLETLQSINGKLDEINKLLAGGRLKVQLVGEDGKPVGGDNAASKPK